MRTIDVRREMRSGDTPEKMRVALREIAAMKAERKGFVLGKLLAEGVQGQLIAQTYELRRPPESGQG